MPLLLARASIWVRSRPRRLPLPTSLLPRRAPLTPRLPPTLLHSRISKMPRLPFLLLRSVSTPLILPCHPRRLHTTRRTRSSATRRASTPPPRPHTSRLSRPRATRRPSTTDSSRFASRSRMPTMPPALTSLLRETPATLRTPRSRSLTSRSPTSSRT